MSQRVISKSLAGPSEICMLMPIREGFTEGLATRSYESRLRSFTKLFADFRAVARESRLSRPFSDIVDRIRTIHGVTIAIMDGRLLLTVHFDQPWEPYIHVIWDRLGHVFDLILCNCEGYVESHRRDLGYEAFAGWIRKYQVETSTFYMNSSHTVDDVIYLDQLERLVRTDHPDAAGLATLLPQSPASQARMVRDALSDDDYVDYIKLGVQAIVAFHALTFLYPKGTQDHGFLLDAARSVLPRSEFPPRAEWQLTEENGKALTTLKAVFATELDWFENYVEGNRQDPESTPDLPFDAENTQGGIVRAHKANVGCLALLQVRDAVAARRFLDGFKPAITWGEQTPADGIFRNIGFTAQGLARLGLPAAELDKLPPAFRDGMAARAGLIGDLRSNHPDQWQMPERNWPLEVRTGEQKLQRVNVEAVDIVIQLRRLAQGQADLAAEDGELIGELERIEKQAAGGIQVLSVQPMYALGKPKQPIEHFGFRDGISNPRLDADNPGDQDVVPAGDIFLGQANSRGDRLAAHWSEPLFKEGTFQVIRKLAQDVQSLHDAVDGNIDPKLPKEQRETQREALLAKMMGRTKAGAPLAAKPGPIRKNAFHFEEDPDGARCPLFAHIRRANPRDRNEAIPRIVRRGMSYGPAYQQGKNADADRGLIFQAYSASLTDQFETLQRWVSGGNRTVPYSGLSDPFLGVPEQGKPRVYRFANGDRLDLGERPFVRLLWGLYLFVPSRVGLSVIAGPHEAREREWTEEGAAMIARLRSLEAQDQDAARRAWKRLLEEKESLDDEQHRGVWQAIRERHGGVLRTPFGVLVGEAGLVGYVLATPRDFSVVGYQERLSRCVGPNYLGMDPPEHDEKADRANEVFNAISKEQGFEYTLPVAKGLLGGLGEVGGQATIPLPKYADLVLAEVAKLWFGVPDQTTLLEMLQAQKPPNPNAAVQAGGEPLTGQDTSHCPFHVISSSRFVFQPRPTDPVDATATEQGLRLRRAMDEFAEPFRQDPDKLPTKVLKNLYAALEKDHLEDDFAVVVLGALLGFMPTVQGNFLFTTRDWIRDGDLWRVQNAYLSARAAGQDEMTAAFEQIEPWLARSMARRPIPAMIHRRATRNLTLGDVPVKKGEMVVVGLVSATAQSDFSDVSPAFGGSYHADPKPTHACPGRKLGMGTLLGMIAALFEVPGTLRRAPSSSALLFDGAQ